jgi:hypothetical protein
MMGSRDCCVEREPMEMGCLGGVEARTKGGGNNKWRNSKKKNWHGRNDNRKEERKKRKDLKSVGSLQQSQDTIR